MCSHSSCDADSRVCVGSVLRDVTRLFVRPMKIKINFSPNAPESIGKTFPFFSITISPLRQLPWVTADLADLAAEPSAVGMERSA